MFGLLRIVGVIRVVRIFRFVLSHAPLGDGDIRGFSAAGDDDDRLAGFGRFVFGERDGNRVLAGVARSGLMEIQLSAREVSRTDAVQLWVVSKPMVWDNASAEIEADKLS